MDRFLIMVKKVKFGLMEKEKGREREGKVTICRNRAQERKARVGSWSE